MKSLRSNNASTNDADNISYSEQEFEQTLENVEDDLDLSPGDPLEEEIEAYLDGELSADEKRAFEQKIENDPELKKRVEDERAAWEALDLLDYQDAPKDVAEATVERLNSETQAELLELEKLSRKQRAIFYAATLGAAVVLFCFGFALFNLYFPDLHQRRERDFRVVERLTLLENAGDIEQLNALAQADLFADPFHQPGERENAFPPGPSGGPQTSKSADSAAAPRETPKKTYAELRQNREFYRNQQRFENLGGTEQAKLRALYKQIELADNSEKLWSTANAYTFWIATALSDAEREQFALKSTQERIDSIRKKQAFFKRMREFAVDSSETRPSSSPFPSGPKVNYNGLRPNFLDAQRPQPQWGRWSVNSPAAAAIRITLPEQLRGEDLSKIYRRFHEFQQSENKSNGNQDDVFSFLVAVDQGELLALTSQNAQDYLRDKTAEERASILGLFVTLSFLENNWLTQANARQTHDFSKNPYFAQGGPFPVRSPFSAPTHNTIRSLAETLKNAPEGPKYYILHNPPQQAWAILLGLHWGMKQAQFYNANRVNSEQRGKDSNGAAEGRGFGPNGGTQGPNFWPNGAAQGRGFEPNGAAQGPSFWPNGAAQGRGFGPNGTAQGKGFGPNGPSQGRGFGPHGAAQGRGFGPHADAQKNSLEPNAPVPHPFDGKPAPNAQETFTQEES